jgi:hypothetical protein
MNQIIRCPSPKMLKKHFSLSVLQIKKLRETCRLGWARSAMDHANIYLGGHGVESIYPEAPYILFVNMGDTYSKTLLYNKQKRMMWIGTWGDWVEKNLRFE